MDLLFSPPLLTGGVRSAAWQISISVSRRADGYLRYLAFYIKDASIGTLKACFDVSSSLFAAGLIRISEVKLTLVTDRFIRLSADVSCPPLVFPPKHTVSMLESLKAETL